MNPYKMDSLDIKDYHKVLEKKIMNSLRCTLKNHFNQEDGHMFTSNIGFSDIIPRELWREAFYFDFESIGIDFDGAVDQGNICSIDVYIMDPHVSWNGNKRIL